MQLLALGMILGATISLVSVWVTVAHILNLKTRRIFEVEIEGKKDINRGIARIREIPPTKQKKVKFGTYRKAS